MLNSFDIAVEKMMDFDIGSSCTLNDNLLCVLKDKFTKWHKDCNSPAMLSEARFVVKCGVYDIDGIVVVQHDSALSQKYYASLFIKQTGEDRLQSMFTVNSIAFM